MKIITAYQSKTYFPMIEAGQPVQKKDTCVTASQITHLILLTYWIDGIPCVWSAFSHGAIVRGRSLVGAGLSEFHYTLFNTRDSPVIQFSPGDACKVGKALIRAGIFINKIEKKIRIERGY